MLAVAVSSFPFIYQAAIVDQFERSREELGENYLMTPQQKEWIKAQESLLSIRPRRQPRPPSNLTRRSVFMIVLNPLFDRVRFLFPHPCSMYNIQTIALLLGPCRSLLVRSSSIPLLWQRHTLVSHRAILLH